MILTTALRRGARIAFNCVVSGDRQSLCVAAFVTASRMAQLRPRDQAKHLFRLDALVRLNTIMSTNFKRNRTLLWIIPVGLSAAVIIAGTSAMAIEEPKYTVSMSDGAFEIRAYHSAIVAEVSVTGDQKSAVNRGFRLLAGYIFGGSTRHQSVAMTSPVAQQRSGEKIAMTAPVTQIPAGDAWTIRFTMPAKYSLETLPKPNDPQVKLIEIPARRCAVVRFSGLASEASVAAKTAALMAFIKTHHLQTTGPAALAQYNPPWTLWFMRRN